MNDPIRITHTETTFEIPGLAALAGLALPFAMAPTSTRRPSGPDNDTMVPGDAEAMQDALAAISATLGCQNTQEDILYAIDALRPSQLEWSATLAAGERVTFKKAETAIAKLNDGLPGGAPRWRMPTRRELESIQDLTKHDPCVDLERYPDTKSGYYWSSTPCAWSPVYAWFVSFDSGYSSYYRRGYYDAFVRAVRAVPSGQ